MLSNSKNLRGKNSYECKNILGYPGLDKNPSADLKPLEQRFWWKKIKSQSLDGKSSICVRREVMWLLFKFCIIMVVKGYWRFMVCSFGLAFWDLLRYHLDRLGLLLIKKILRLRDWEKKRHQIVARFRNRIFIWICFMLKAHRYFLI